MWGLQWYLAVVPCILAVNIACIAASVSGYERGWAKYSQDNYKVNVLPRPIKLEIWAGYVRGELGIVLRGGADGTSCLSLLQPVLNEPLATHACKSLPSWCERALL